MEADWITRCLSAASKKQQVDPRAARCVEDMLRADGACRKLSPAESARVATSILDALKPKSEPEPQTGDEAGAVE